MEDIVDLDTGKLSQKEINLVLNSLPLDITFVDAHNQVKYFNRFEKRFFKRPKSVIGKEVQNCHPKKSLAAVEEILNDFKSKKETAPVSGFTFRIDLFTYAIALSMMTAGIILAAWRPHRI
ncbi:MAG: PAS domain-containing protein [Actinomycetota bacterium]|nr:PAS domain-containing protein [Actinomycetota bacterium]